MKKTKITIEFDQEKLKALQIYYAEKGNTVEKELEESLQKSYVKNVPAVLRSYIEQSITVNDSFPAKSKKKDKSTFADLPSLN